MTDTAEAIAQFPIWYHSIELPGGAVTPGLFDTRRAARKGLMPASLAGKRCLDVGTSDGFWAFEMERRGASEVVAIDLVDPADRDVTVEESAHPTIPKGLVSSRFALASELLSSQVDYRNLSVYDLSPEKVGTFDFVFMGSLLLHLRDPVLALQAIRSVTGGELLSYDAVSAWLSLFHPRKPSAVLNGLTGSNWWLPNKAGHQRLIVSAGFDIIRTAGVTFVKAKGSGMTLKQFVRHPFASSLLRAYGVPQAWVLARPST